MINDLEPPNVKTVEELRRHVMATRREQIHGLRQLQPWRDLKILAFLGLWALGALAWVISPWLAPVTWVLGTIGVLGNAILMHDASHGTLARDPRWNRWLGFICGAPVLIPTTAYGVHHTLHHAHTGTDLDTGDPVAHANRTGWSVEALTVVFLLCGSFLVIPGLTVGAWRRTDAARRRRILVELVLIGVGVTLAILVLPTELLLHAWIVPILLGGLANNIRSIAEHSFTDRTDAIRNSRTVLGSPLLNLVQSNINYHWEHHLFPSVPWYHLPALHRLLQHERQSLRVPTAVGYGGFFWYDVIPRLRRAAGSR